MIEPICQNFTVPVIDDIQVQQETNNETKIELTGFSNDDCRFVLDLRYAETGEIADPSLFALDQPYFSHTDLETSTDLYQLSQDGILKITPNLPSHIGDHSLELRIAWDSSFETYE